MPNYSVVIPVFNEEESLDVLTGELKKTFEGLTSSFEIIFVNDGSTDGSLRRLNKLKERHNGMIKIVNLTERKGQTHALCQGMGSAKGEVVVTLDADLQNDPADIPLLLAKMQEGFDVVCGWRKNRSDASLKTFLSKLGNALQRFFTGTAVHDVSCTLRACQKKCLKDLQLTWEGQHRFIPLILSLRGYKIGEVVSHHRGRRFSSSKYGHRRIFKVMGDFFRILLERGKMS